MKPEDRIHEARESFIEIFSPERVDHFNANLFRAYQPAFPQNLIME